MGTIGIAGQGLTAVPGDDGLPTADHLVQGLIPCRGSKLTFTLGADAAQRCKHALRRMHALSIAVHLAAEKSPRERVCWITHGAHHLPCLYCHQHATGIRAVVRTHGAHCPTGSSSLHCFSLSLCNRVPSLDIRTFPSPALAQLYRRRAVRPFPPRPSSGPWS